MAPFNIPTPCIIPLRVPVFGENRNIDTNTKIELLCETDIPNVEIFYTLDGTKPQPYSGIIQGSKIKRFIEPFCLPSGKITIKAVAIHAQIHSMCSSVITKCYRVDNVAHNLGTVKDIFKSKCKLREKNKSGTKLRKSFETDTEDKFDDVDSTIKFLDSEDKLSESHNTSSEKLSTYPATSSFLQYEIEENIIEVKDKDSEDSNATYIIDSEENVNHEQQSPVHSFKENETVEDDSEIEVKETATSCDILSAQDHNCSTCEMPLQHCFACNKVNTIVSKYCGKCGKKLVKQCVYCQENNPSIAIFCQYCGKKIELNQEREHNVPSSSSNRSVMVKPQVKSFSAQKSPTTMNRCVQTITVVNKKNIQEGDLKNLPKQTPGRGYWRQQIDYICNHLKAHAYNNLDFRKSIGEPSLHEFLAANILKKNDNIIVQMEFSSLNPEQCN